MEKDLSKDWKTANLCEMIVLLITRIQTKLYSAARTEIESESEWMLKQQRAVSKRKLGNTIKKVIFGCKCNKKYHSISVVRVEHTSILLF